MSGLYEESMISRQTLKPVATVLAVGLAIFQIYFTAGFGVMDSQMLRVIHLGTVLTPGLYLLSSQEAGGRRQGKSPVAAS